ncbi:MAG: hypothetical protein ACR2KW_04280 [Rubrobacter sp.]
MTGTKNRPVDEGFDPLAEDYLADPYRYYARFRRESPVFYAPKIDFWVVSRYRDVQKIVTDPDAYSNARVQEPISRLEPEALDALKSGVRVVSPRPLPRIHPHTAGRALWPRKRSRRGG